MRSILCFCILCSLGAPALADTVLRKEQSFEFSPSGELHPSAARVVEISRECAAKERQIIQVYDRLVAAFPKIPRSRLAVRAEVEGITRVGGGGYKGYSCFAALAADTTEAAFFTLESEPFKTDEECRARADLNSRERPYAINQRIVSGRSGFLGIFGEYFCKVRSLELLPTL